MTNLINNIRSYGMTYKLISLHTGIPVATLKSYSEGRRNAPQDAQEILQALHSSLSYHMNELALEMITLRNRR